MEELEEELDRVVNSSEAVENSPIKMPIGAELPLRTNSEIG